MQHQPCRTGNSLAGVSETVIDGAGAEFDAPTRPWRLRAGCVPKPVKTASSIGSNAVTLLARITQSHIGSNFFHPAAYAMCRRRCSVFSLPEAPLKIEFHL